MRQNFQYLGSILVAGFCGVMLATTLSSGGALLVQTLKVGNTLVYRNRTNQVAEVSAVVPTTPVAPLLPAAPPPPAPTLTTLTFVGDTMLDRSVAASVKNHGGGDFNWLFAKVRSLSQADILYANLEGPISDQGADRHNLYSFRMNPAVLPVLQNLGVDVAQVANNHIGDWGNAAFTDTLSRLDAAGIVSVGAGENKAALPRVKIIERNGIKFGFLAATDVGPDWLAATADKPGVQLASDPDWPGIITAAAKQVDVLVVGYHFGDEYQTAPSARQRALAELAIDHGARLVIGTHPHVVEPVEDYHGGVIAYSLGNFIFDQYFSPATMSGLVLSVVFNQTEIVSVVKQNVMLDQNFQPELAE